MNTGKWGFYNGEQYDIIETEQDVEKLCNCLKANLLSKENTICKLRNIINEIDAEAYKDEELAKMKSQYKEMEADYYRGFPISEQEEKQIREWMKKHEEEHNGGHGAIGGKYTYEFIPTSIGTFGTIKCSCGQSFEFQTP